MTANPAFRLFDLGTNSALTAAIAEELEVPVAPVELKTFADNEIYERIVDSVRGIDVYVVAPVSAPVNDSLMKLLIFIDAAKRTSAKSINLIVPYLAYGRSDRKAKPREPIAGRLVANLLQDRGIKRLMTMDLHTSQLQGFFDIPVDHLLAMPVQAAYYEQQGLTGGDIVVVSSDANSLKMVQRLAEVLDAPWAIVDQDRDPNIEPAVTGHVAGKHAIIVDDMIDTGQTMVKAAKAVQQAGATKIDALATHALLSGSAAKDLQDSVLDRVVVTNTVAVPENARFDKLVTLSVAALFAEGIQHVIHHDSLAPVLLSPAAREEAGQ
ncbi:ribose-phosphate pyrophosphokinase [Leuconostocaceae bacterium ESL0958]|nr:ribose-phosphate pyrophosphokinase [Leuconostocaceae bacterium ESL0958]